jgi:predicted nucleotidyltransferase
LPDFIVPPQRPLDALLLDILRRVDGVARAQNVGYFLGGALARDVILQHVFDKDTGRATRDVDLGIFIDDWHKFAMFKAGLLQDGHFLAQAKIVHRLTYLPPDTSTHGGFGIPLDLLPFGGLETTDAQIAWPPDMAVIMNVAGFAEAHASALLVQISADLVIPVTSLPSLAVLKLMAWRDRHLQTGKDATDFLLIVRHYCDAGNVGRLYETESALLHAFDFDSELAGAMLLGKDAQAICRESTAQAVHSLFDSPELKQRLLDQMLRAALLAGDNTGSARTGLFLDAFYRGFLCV